MGTETFKVRKNSHEWREVVADYKATQKCCTRCGYSEPTVIGEKVDWFSSCSMPDYMWDEMRKKGFVKI